MEGIAAGTKRRTALAGGVVADSVAAAVQAGAALHPGRGRRGARLVAHPEHRPDAANSFQAFAG